jgi:hypothetical protein
MYMLTGSPAPKNHHTRHILTLCKHTHIHTHVCTFSHVLRRLESIIPCTFLHYSNTHTHMYILTGSQAARKHRSITTSRYCMAREGRSVVTCTYVYVCIYIYICVCVCVCVCVCCMCVRALYVRACVRVYVCSHIYTYI